MIKITIKDAEGKDLVEIIQVISFYVALCSVILFIGINFMAFVTWTYPSLMLRTSIAFFILGSVFTYVFSLCSKAIEEYYYYPFKKDRK